MPRTSRYWHSSLAPDRNLQPVGDTALAATEDNAELLAIQLVLLHQVSVRQLALQHVRDPLGGDLLALVCREDLPGEGDGRHGRLGRV